MKEHLKTSYVEVTEAPNEDGVMGVIDIKRHQYLAGSGDEFFLVYSSLMNIWERWELSIADLNLYAHLCGKYANGSEFTINSTIKQRVADLSNKSITTFNNSTRNLLKKGLIVKVGHKLYKINPRHLFKGSSKNRKKALFEILQDCSNC